MFSWILAFKDDLWGFLLFGLNAGLAGVIFQALLRQILGEERLRSIFSLSEAEARIASALAGGSTIDEVAELLTDTVQGDDNVVCRVLAH